MITRQVIPIPAVVVISLTGEQSTHRLLVASQVILSLQLSFAVIPLIHFTSNRKNMGPFATPLWGQVMAWTAAAVIVALNGKLVLDQVGEWVNWADASSVLVGPIPLSMLVAIAATAVARTQPACSWCG